MAHWHTIRKGESLPSVAERYGFADWNAIYDHAKNADFKELRPDPYVLAPGDQVFIPNKEQKYLEVAAEQRHTFQLTRRMEVIRLVMEADDGTVFDGRRYELVVGDETFEGTTDGEGLLEAKVPAIADEATLTLWLDAEQSFTWTIAIGQMDPVDTTIGVQARLNNLGFPCPEDGTWTSETAEAVRAFQTSQGLEPTGELDKATTDQLVAAHGS